MLLRPRESTPATFVMRPMRLPRAHSGGFATNWSSPGRTAGALRTAEVVAGADPDAQPATSHAARTTRCTIDCPERTVAMVRTNDEARKQRLVARDAGLVARPWPARRFPAHCGPSTSTGTRMPLAGIALAISASALIAVIPVAPASRTSGAAA